MSPWKKLLMALCRSKLTSAKYLNSLPKCRMAEDFPTCLAPRISKGFLIGFSFHVSSWASIFREIYSCIAVMI